MNLDRIESETADELSTTTAVLKLNLDRIESGSDGFDSKGRIKLKLNLDRIESHLNHILCPVFLC